MLATATDGLIDFMDTEIEAVSKQTQIVKQNLEALIDEAEKCSTEKTTASEATSTTTVKS
jgi:hypothetical protein